MSKTLLAISEDFSVLKFLIISCDFVICLFKASLSFKSLLTILYIFFGLHFDWSSSGIISSSAARKCRKSYSWYKNTNYGKFKNRKLGQF